MVLQRPFGHLHLWLAASFKAPYTCLLGLSACFFCIWSVFRFMDVALQGFTGFCSFCRALNGFYAVFFACTVYCDMIRNTYTAIQPFIPTHPPTQPPPICIHPSTHPHGQPAEPASAPTIHPSVHPCMHVCMPVYIHTSVHPCIHGCILACIRTPMLHP